MTSEAAPLIAARRASARTQSGRTPGRQRALPVSTARLRRGASQALRARTIRTARPRSRETDARPTSGATRNRRCACSTSWTRMGTSILRRFAAEMTATIAMGACIRGPRRSATARTMIAMERPTTSLPLINGVRLPRVQCTSARTEAAFATLRTNAVRAAWIGRRTRTTAAPAGTLALAGVSALRGPARARLGGRIVGGSASTPRRTCRTAADAARHVQLAPRAMGVAARALAAKPCAVTPALTQQRTCRTAAGATRPAQSALHAVRAAVAARATTSSVAMCVWIRARTRRIAGRVGRSARPALHAARAAAHVRAARRFAEACVWTRARMSPTAVSAGRSAQRI